LNIRVALGAIRQDNIRADCRKCWKNRS